MLTATSVATSEAATTASEAASVSAEATAGLEALTAGSNSALLVHGLGSLSKNGARHEELGVTGLLGVSVQLVAGLEALGLDTLVGLDGEAGLVHRTEDIVDLADLVLVLQVDATHEKGHVAADHIANQKALAGVRELSNGLDILGGTLLEA